MLRFVAGRVAGGAVVVLLATGLVFAVVAARGDPLADLRRRPNVSQETIASLEERYHLDRSKPVQYVLWLGDFARGDWGTSFDTRRSVSSTIGRALGNTALLAGAALLVSVLAATAVGVASAARRGSAFDHAATGLSYLGFSMPVFWLGLLLQLGLVVYLREWFDVRLFYLQGKHSTGNEGDLLDLARHMVLPVLTLSVGLAAAWSRYLRDSTVDALRSDFVRTARAKGASRRRVVWGHAWRASLVPFATVVAIDAGALVGGAVVTERIFGWPGMGTLFLRALSNDDYPVLLAWMAVTTVAVVLFNLVADLLYGVLDPRVRYR